MRFIVKLHGASALKRGRSGVSVSTKANAAQNRGAPDVRRTAPAAKRVCAAQLLYVLVTRKVSLTYETNRGQRR